MSINEACVRALSLSCLVRCKDLAAQNSLLHQHLESVSTQAARIRQAADSSALVVGEGEGNDDADTKLSELRSVVAYLRKEKEIVDLQLELSKQENLRLKSQIDHVSQNLEETRKMLSEVCSLLNPNHSDLTDHVTGTRACRGSRCI